MIDVTWDYSGCTQPDRAPTSAEIVAITIASLKYLRSVNERSAIRETVAAIVEAYGLAEEWKLELWRELPEDLRQWMKPTASPIAHPPVAA